MCFMHSMTEEQGNRLKELRLMRGFETAADAARAYGWPTTTYQAHENGSRGVKIDVARRYAKAFGTTAAFILTGAKSGPALEQASSPPVNLVSEVPVVARASAGTFRLDEELIGDEAFSVPALPRRGIPASAQYAIIVDGTSVNKRIPDGAFAICAKYDRYPGGVQHGQLVHVIRERSGLREHTIKEIRFTAEGTILMPVSTDPKYQSPLRLSTGEDGEIVRIEGIVIGVFQAL
jgi:SOS-response transcriptional repressor LexA